MQFTSRILFAALALCLAGSASAQAVRDYSATKDLQMDVLMERHDIVMHIDHAAVAAVVSHEHLDSLMAKTRDFRGQEMTTFVLFDKSVTEARLRPLAEYQGRLKGTVACGRVRVGSSPVYQQYKIAALGEQCKIVTLSP